MDKIINLTQHLATPEQVEAGIVDLTEPVRTLVVRLLNFDELPTHDEIVGRAKRIVKMLGDVSDTSTKVMMGGAPFLVEPLSVELRKHGFVPCFAFSKRVSVEQAQLDGSVKKISVFKHTGLIEM